MVEWDLFLTIRPLTEGDMEAVFGESRVLVAGGREENETGRKEDGSSAWYFTGSPSELMVRLLLVVASGAAIERGEKKAAGSFQRGKKEAEVASPVASGFAGGGRRREE
ncbi:hypothetical protein HAX54_033395 [Datura stramonium]|uniref:Uncharacterized protein n=1 Tax=Datura stramonium TaxID=4076 RepID=A0ABS8SDL5_DATST|nr:hypothetical protein [Datura stramonium]